MKIIRYRNPKTSAYLYHAFKQESEGDRWFDPLCNSVKSHHFRAGHSHPEFDPADDNPPERILCPRCIRLFNAL